MAHDAEIAVSQNAVPHDNLLVGQATRDERDLAYFGKEQRLQVSFSGISSTRLPADDDSENLALSLL